MMVIHAIILVDTDDPTEVTDGLNEGFRQLEGEYDGWIVDWAYPGEPIPVPVLRENYYEGQAFQTTYGEPQ